MIAVDSIVLYKVMQRNLPQKRFVILNSQTVGGADGNNTGSKLKCEKK